METQTEQQQTTTEQIKEILKLMFFGYNKKQIAEILNISIYELNKQLKEYQKPDKEYLKYEIEKAEKENNDLMIIQFKGSKNESKNLTITEEQLKQIKDILTK